MKWFTLTELMIVIAIMGVMAAIFIPAYQQYNDPNYVRPATTTSYIPNVGSITSFCNNGKYMYEHDNILYNHLDDNGFPQKCN